MQSIPVSLTQANEFIVKHHRHHGALKFHKYSIGVENEGKLVGVCIVNRPVNPRMDTGHILEVARLCTDGTKNACSFLLARASAVAKNLGYSYLQTYTLADETIQSRGASMWASGWLFSHVSRGGSWNSGKRNRIDKHPIGEKFCWIKELKR